MKTKKCPSFCGKEPTLFMENKVLLYKVIVKLVITHDSKLWGLSFKSNVSIILVLAGAPSCVPDDTQHEGIVNVPLVEDEYCIRLRNSSFSAKNSFIRKKNVHN